MLVMLRTFGWALVCGVLWFALAFTLAALHLPPWAILLFGGPPIVVLWLWLCMRPNR